MFIELLYQTFISSGILDKHMLYRQYCSLCLCVHVCDVADTQGVSQPGKSFNRGQVAPCGFVSICMCVTVI